MTVHVVIIDLLDKVFDFFFLPSVLRGEYVFRTHLILFYVFMVIVPITLIYQTVKRVPISPVLLQTLLGFYVSLLILFLMNGTCLLFQVEQHYRPLDKTIVDHLLCQVNSTNRQRISLFWFLGVIVLIFAVQRIHKK